MATLPLASPLLGADDLDEPRPDAHRLTLLLGYAIRPAVHRRDCTGQDRTPPSLRAINELLGALIDLKWEYGDALSVCLPADRLGDLRHAHACLVKCLTCDLERAEKLWHRVRGAMYDVPDCCIRPLGHVREGTRLHCNRIANAWELPLPFPQTRDPADDVFPPLWRARARLARRRQSEPRLAEVNS